MKVAFDIGGVLSKYPDVFRPLIVQLQHTGIEVFVITDMHDVEKIAEMLAENDFARRTP
jgi:predicted glycosyltransferase